MFTTAGLIVLIAAVLGSGAMVGVLAWLWFRLRRLEDRALRRGDDRLLDEIERLREEVEAARSDTRALTEQVDFMERLLASGEEGRSENEDASG